MTYYSRRSPALRRPSVRYTDPAELIIYTVLIVAALLALALWPYPVPAPVRTPAVTDTGWHMAQDSYGHVYRIDLRYDGMNGVQQDDANRFSHEYPDGEGS